jgi:hypothetical protein
MTQNCRDFIASSTAATFLTVSNASAQGVAVTRKIGVFHTTQISDQEWDCFKAGLGSNWVPTKEDELKGNYGGNSGHKKLKDSIHNKKNSLDVVVAAGGVTAQLSAFEELDPPMPPPYVYMSGRAAKPTASSPTNGKYCGVILNISELYDNALNNNFHLQKSDVLLIQNYNGDFAPDELAKNWGYNNPSFRFFESSVPIDNPDPSNSNAVQNAFTQEWNRFARLYPKPKGVIVSPDAYFRLTAQPFKIALQNALSGIPVCYPFSDYGPISSPDFLLPNAPTLSSTTTTDVNNAYYVLGARTADVLNNLSSGNPIPPSKIDSKQWDGSTRQWKSV